MGTPGFGTVSPARPAAPRRPRASGSQFAALGVLIAASLVVFGLEVVTAPFSGALDGTLVEHGGLSGPAVDG
ncbi:MAG TPA: hypothetical protein VK506_01470, partial [Conexibacter sp.]|nr:hypothetical protein [Conexibacter sp.]